MPEPTQRDARDAEESALAEVYSQRDALERCYAPTDEDEAAFREAVRRYGEACRTTARAELLQSGTPVWVAHDEGGAAWSFAHNHEPELRDGLYVISSYHSMAMHAALTPPGTCVEARVVLIPVGEAS